MVWTREPDAQIILQFAWTEPAQDSTELGDCVGDFTTNEPSPAFWFNLYRQTDSPILVLVLECPASP